MRVLEKHMKFWTTKDTGGAALVEYVILLALISILSIGSVMELGSRISETFETTTTAIETAGVDPDPGPGTTFTWKGDGSDTLPPGVTDTSGGWIIDINSVPGYSSTATDLRYDAWISQSGSFSKRRADWADSTSSYSINVRSYWQFEDSSDLPLAQDAAMGTPSGVVTAYGEALDRLVPADVTGIRFERIFSCNPGSICENGAFDFNITFH
jgi:Flp pilus assembly pilin Flp